MVHCIYYGYSYLPDSSLSSCWVDTDVTNGKIHYNYDTYKRVTSKVYDFYVKSASATRRFTNTVSYTFSTNGKHGSAQVASYTSGVNKDAAVTSTYTYDGNGNITKIALSNGQEYRYVYTTTWGNCSARTTVSKAARMYIPTIMPETFCPRKPML